MRLLILLTSVLIAGHLAGQDVPKGMIEGTVVDEVTGEPVRRAGVMLTGQRTNRPGESSVVQTQADGKFHFEGLEPGSFYLIARKNGYVDSGMRGRPTPIQLTAGEQKTGITIKLTPQGIISGRVFDEEGEPVQMAHVQIFQRRKMSGKLRWQTVNGGATNDRGEYRVAGLTAGEYAVSANYQDPMAQMGSNPQSRIQVYAPTYYPNGTDLNAAQAVTVEKGAEAAGIDLRLRKEAAYRIRVRVEGVSAEQLQQVNVSVTPRETSEVQGRMGGNSGVRRLEPGVFELVGVRAGSWLVQAQLFQQGGEPLMGVTPVDVSTADVLDAVVRIGGALQVTGTLVFEGTPAAKIDWKSYNVRLMTPEGGGFGMAMMRGRPAVTEDGAFTLTVGLPGKYVISAYGPSPDKMYLASIKVGNEEYFGKEIDLTNGAPGPVKIIYRNDAAAVSGKLEGDLEGAAGALGLAVLMPADTALRRAEFMQAVPVQSGGSFQFGAVRPGEYLVCHMMGDQQSLYENGEPPKESMDAAVRVKAEANGTQSVTVKAVKAEPAQ